MKEILNLLRNAGKSISMVARKKKDTAGEISLPGPDVMAYLGDALFELFVRLALVDSGGEVSRELHQKAVRIVNAASQADIFMSLKDFLSSEELKVFKRGRNIRSGQVPRGTRVTDYRTSTGLESLLGYLLLKEDYCRIEEIFAEIYHYLQKQGKFD